MTTKTQTPAATLEPAQVPVARIFGVGSAGVALLEVINRIELSHSSAARSAAGRRLDIARLAQSAV